MGFDLGAIIPLAGAAVGAYFGGPAGAAAGGSIGAGMSSYMGQSSANQMNSEEAWKARDWQERMRATNHQAEVSDLEKAGLNPILSANGGATTPGTSMPTMQNPAGDMPSAFSNAVNSAVSLKDLANRTALNSAQVTNTQQDTENKKASQALIENQQSSTAKDVEAKALSNHLLKETMSSQIKKAKSEGDYSEINQIMGIINHGASSVNQLVNPMKLFGK